MTEAYTSISKQHCHYWFLETHFDLAYCQPSLAHFLPYLPSPLALVTSTALDSYATSMSVPHFELSHPLASLTLTISQQICSPWAVSNMD